MEMIMLVTLGSGKGGVEELVAVKVWSLFEFESWC